MAKTLAVYDRSDPGAARVIIVGGSDFAGTSPKLICSETLVFLLPGAELNQMLTLVVAIKSEMPCELELLLFAGMNDHLHAAGLLEHLKGKAPTPKKIWEAIQTLFAAMSEVQESVVSRFGPRTRVAFTTSPGYASMPPSLQFVYAMLILIAVMLISATYTGARVWGVVKGFHIACNFTDPIGDLTGTGDQPSGKAGLKKGTREVLERSKRHPARTRTNREGYTEVFCLVSRRTTGRLDRNR